MKKRLLLLGVSVAAAALACGEVPTLDQGIAYISPIILPAPAVAAGDQLRDSLGNVAPLRIEAFGRNDEPLPDPQATFLPTVVPSPISISGDGIVTADTVSTVKTVQIVGRVGSKLQTTAVNLLVVPQPDSLGRTSDSLTTATLPASDTMRVTVTGLTGAGTRVAVPGILVRYRIAGVYGPGADSATAVLTLPGGALSRPDSRLAVDTTDASGLASRILVVAGNVDSVVVYVRARSLRGEPLHGDSLRFILRPTQ
ncbi:MAG TPA: hypothetical protein VFY85_00030 [Gemmatimonadaceae bacterium]|nr:hypothetical protein [Gemmatimonadaceae bacterium]